MARARRLGATTEWALARGDVAGAVAAVITSSRALDVLTRFTRGKVRYRIAWAAGGRRRALNFRVAALVSERSPELMNDPKAAPPDKYKVLANVLDWATNVGYPGYATASIDEVFNTFVIPTMFAKAAQDVLSPEDAVRDAEKEIQRIFDKWK